MAKDRTGGKRASGENAIYKPTDAYKSYQEKMYKLSGTSQNEDGTLNYGNRMFSGKQYTNDEFMEHLEDGNWNSLYKAILDNKLTNKEVTYLKDNMKLGLWSFGDYKKMNSSRYSSTKDYVDAIISDVKRNAGQVNENKLRTMAKKLADEISKKEGISYTEAMKKAIKKAEKQIRG